MDRETRNHIQWIALLWVVFTALSEWGVQRWIDHWPTLASREAEITGEAIFFLLRAVAPVFILIVLIVAYSAIRFRVPEGDDRPAAAQFTTGWLFVSVWVGLSLVINVIFVFYPGIYGLEALWSAAAAENPLTIEVTGKQWQWDYHYPDQNVSTTDELVVPLGRPVRFVLTSADVMHSFWVPAWGMKKAVIPGETRVMTITPTEVLDTAEDPVLRVQCAQICGVGHPLMRSDVRVLAAADFDAWVAGQKAPAAAMPGMDMNSGGAMPGMDMNGDGGAPANGDGAMMTMPDGTTMPASEMPQGDAMPMDENAMPMDEGGAMPMDEGTMTMPDGTTMPTDAMPDQGTGGN